MNKRLISILVFLIFVFVLNHKVVYARIEKFYVENVFDNEDKIIVSDLYGAKYLVEYGIGCGLSMWRYEDEFIYIDIGGAFLDGISDTIYLPDSDDSCNVWDAEEIDDTSLSIKDLLLYNLMLESFKKSCPPNSTFNGTSCVCNEGYVAYNNECITYNQMCQLKYGPYSYGDKNYCYCLPGYEFNKDNSACVKALICPINSYKVGNSCICKEGYIMKDGKCITHTEHCIKQFGPNVYGKSGPKNTSLCYCKRGYKWNSSKTECIPLSKREKLKVN